MPSSRGKPSLRTRIDFRPARGARLRASLSIVARSTSSRRRVARLMRCAADCAADRHEAMGSAQLRQMKQRLWSRNRRITRSSTDALLAIRGGPVTAGGPTAAVPGLPWLSPASPPTGDAYSTMDASSSVMVSSLRDRASRFPRSRSTTASRSWRPAPMVSAHQMSPLVVSSVMSSSARGPARSHRSSAVFTCWVVVGVMPRSSIRTTSIRPDRAARPTFVPRSGDAVVSSAAGRTLRTSRASKPTIVCGRPSSRMVKSSRVRPRIGAPARSRTTASTVMAEAWDGKDGVRSAGGSCAARTTASGTPAASTAIAISVDRCISRRSPCLLRCARIDRSAPSRCAPCGCSGPATGPPGSRGWWPRRGRSPRAGRGRTGSSRRTS